MCLTYVNKTSISLYSVLCLKGRHVQFVIEQTRFVSAVFLYSEFKLFAGTLNIFTDRGKNHKNCKN